MENINKPHKFSPSQILRISVGIGLLIIVGVIYIPYALFTYSSHAVVSARIVTLTTPIDGMVAKAPPPAGTELHAGDVIAKFVNTTVDRSTVGQLNVEKASLERLIQGLNQQKINLNKFVKELEGNKIKYTDARKSQSNYEIDQAKKRYEELLASVSENSRLLNRRQHLYKSGNMSVTNLDNTFFSTERATKSAEQAKTEWDRLMAERKNLDNDIFVNQDGRSEVIYHDQRRDEIRISIEEIDARLGENESRLVAINERIRIEESRLSGLEAREIVASGNSVILHSYIMEGSHVDEKTKIVDIIDCSKVFVDATINGMYFEKIKIGERVDVTLEGTPKKLHGTVIHLRGGATFAEPEKNIAGVAPLRRPHEMQVLIQIDPDDLYNTAQDYCYVGRTAEVIFNGMRGT